MPELWCLGSGQGLDLGFTSFFFFFFLNALSVIGKIVISQMRLGQKCNGPELTALQVPQSPPEWRHLAEESFLCALEAKVLPASFPKLLPLPRAPASPSRPVQRPLLHIKSSPTFLKGLKD